MDMPAALTEIVRGELHPAMRAAGLRPDGRQRWWEGTRDEGFVIVEVQRHTYNSADRVRFTVNTFVWPAGTTEIYEEIFATTVEQPFSGYQGPIGERPEAIDPSLATYRRQGLLRRRVAAEDFWWELRPVTDHGRLAREVVSFCVERALPFAGAHRSGDAAVERMSRQPVIWGQINAVAHLLRVRPHDPRLPGMIERLDEQWRRDPRPEGLGGVLERWQGGR